MNGGPVPTNRILHLTERQLEAEKAEAARVALAVAGMSLTELGLTVEDLNKINGLLGTAAEGRPWSERMQIADLQWKLTFFGQKLEAMGGVR